MKYTSNDSDPRSRVWQPINDDYCLMWAPAVLRRMGHDHARLLLTYREACDAAIQAAEVARKASVSAPFLARLVAGEDFASVLAAIDDGGSATYEARAPALAHPAAWAAGRPEAAGDAPPQGWSGLPDAAVATYAATAYPKRGAREEATRRWPRPTSLGGSDYAGRVAIMVGGEVMRVAGVDAPLGAAVATTPAATGWVETASATWCGVEVFAALSRVQARATSPGALDVRGVVDAYGVHETRGFPRLAYKAWKHILVVGLDDQVGRIMADLAMVKKHCPARVPEGAWRIPARVTTTANGGLCVRYDREAAESTALVVVSGHAAWSSCRHGWSGATCAPTKDTRCPVASAAGGSNGGGQQASVVVGAPSARAPLLLDDGRGITVDADGVAWMVVGLATGHPGARSKWGGN